MRHIHDTDYSRSIIFGIILSAILYYIISFFIGEIPGSLAIFIVAVISSIFVYILYKTKHKSINHV